MAGPEDVIFGTCQVCGANGGDAAAGDITPADSNTNIVETGNGVPLKKHKGMMKCEICIKEAEANDESIKAAEMHAKDDTFLAKAGFVKTIT